MEAIRVDPIVRDPNMGLGDLARSTTAEIGNNARAHAAAVTRDSIYTGNALRIEGIGRNVDYFASLIAPQIIQATVGTYAVYELMEKFI